MVPVPVAVALPQPDQVIPRTVLLPSAFALIWVGSVTISAPSHETAGSWQTVMTIAGAVVVEEDVGWSDVVALPLGVAEAPVGVFSWVGVMLGLGVATAVGVGVPGATTAGLGCGCWLRA
jgi:hypothetical protein